MNKISQTSGFSILFVRMVTVTIVDLQNFKTLTVSTVKMTIYVTVPSLVVFGQNNIVITIFLLFKLLRGRF